ncbi:IS66 family transposase zinc-finger binding domain-containing protein [Bradyrhizobium elkanii]|uniref:IS66 family transposase zinc-finger binding domain-containing protein n=1 Tax=Bradyrhizobium elkanii TaxID=29448 RepID=UPI0020113ADC|nr:IS66 family transposase zinc-finger binding domain-containing protein [Bradyrhizobium elkanii]
MIEQLELELEELVTTASEDELAAQAAAAKTQNVRPFMRKRPVRQPWPDDIEHERVVIEAPTNCACCGGSRLAKIGEDVTKTLEEIPRRFKVIETVREKVTCRDCEKISQPPAPFHATPRGFIGPQLLATILFDKFGMHIQFNRQNVRFKAERIDLPLSTLADQGRSRNVRRHAAVPADRASCARGRAPSWRRHHHPHSREGQVHDRPDLDVCAG